MEVIKNDIQIKFKVIDGQPLRVGIREGNPNKTPLLLFNGIGANIELLLTLIEQLEDIEVIIFDIPGTGSSPTPLLPYHLSSIAVMTDKLLTQLGYNDQVDVMGVSWGGTIAQEFVRLYSNRCRRLILAATTPGMGMVHGETSVLSKMLSIKRYTDPEYMVKISGELYGGVLRQDNSLIKEHAATVIRPAIRGYFYQLLAIMNWSSLLWLKEIKQPTLVLHGDDDPIIPLINAEIIADQIPNSTLQVFSDGHLFLLSKSTETAQAVFKFLHE